LNRQLLRILGLVLLLVVPAPAPFDSRPLAQGRQGGQDGAVHFAVIGDMGTGGQRQREVGAMMEKVRAERFPFTFVLTVGDNMYGSQTAAAFQRKFVAPYKALLDAGVTFHAALGNHDIVARQRDYELFNMNGHRFYTFTRGPAQFFALDSTLMTREQLRWLEEQLAESRAPWKIAYMHHPLYSSGRRHGPSVLRQALEPLLATYGVQAVFAGHEHFYERLVPQRGVQHFITGAGGRLRLLNIRRGKETAAGYDTDNSFMVARIRGDELYFESISRRGFTVDAGIVNRLGGTRPAPPTSRPQ